MNHVLMLAQRSGAGGAAAAGAGLILLVIYLAIAIVIIAGMWKTYSKAGQPGWGCIIPIYNTYLLLKIAGRPWWWLLLYLIPIVNIIVAIVVMVDIAKSFGGGIGLALGLIFLSPIFFCIIGFGSAQYQGPAAA